MQGHPPDRTAGGAPTKLQQAVRPHSSACIICPAYRPLWGNRAGVKKRQSSYGSSFRHCHHLCGKSRCFQVYGGFKSPKSYTQTVFLALSARVFLPGGDARSHVGPTGPSARGRDGPVNALCAGRTRGTLVNSREQREHDACVASDRIRTARVRNLAGNARASGARKSKSSCD